MQYDYNGYIVDIYPYFVYEVSISKYWKNGYSLLNTKYYKSNKPLNFKRTVLSKEFKNYSIKKEIVLIGVPKEYAIHEHLSYKKKAKK